MTEYIKNKIFHLRKRLGTLGSRHYIQYLKDKGVSIGDNFIIKGDINSILIDVTRPSLVKIGDNVAVNHNFKLLTHDFVSRIFIRKFNEFIPSSGQVVIGNNVSFGMDCTVLKNVTIGDNCFIGIGSIVSKDIPSNSIAAGSPAKVICTIDEYFEKRKLLQVEEAFAYARSIKERFGRRPVIEDFWEEFPLFVNGNEVSKFPMLPIEFQLGDAYENWVHDHRAPFNGFDDFLNKAGL
ncbi:acyltransferase [Maribacter sp. TH_r10]|uniref:acyltransferase n=1 Tax=Maribacter sp. TH_r10 TaxID=3082086 RepID=UPI002952A7B9|nr:acyltransferase [Maribacter sp. TH_r10]MDV7140117.1 acyltransferase [Maribacter sp. TH_r10]